MNPEKKGGNLVYLLCALMFVFSCQTEIQFETDFIEEGLVTNSELVAGDKPFVLFFKSNSPLAEVWMDQPLNDIEAVIIDEDNNKTSLYPKEFHDLYYYYTDTTMVLQANIAYTLKAKHPIYGEIESEATIPQSLQETDVEAVYLNIVKGNLENPVDFAPDLPNVLTITINKTHENQRYAVIKCNYVFKLFENESDSLPSFHAETIVPVASNIHPADNLYPMTILDITDQGIGKKTYQLEAGILFEDYADELIDQSGLADPTVFNGFFLDLKLINYDFRSYILSASNNTVSSPFQEPSAVYGNITNGYGILATSAGGIWEIEITD